MPQKLWLSLMVLAFHFKASAQAIQPPQNLRKYISIKTIPAALYAQQMPAICKAELLLQKKTGVPVYFRLGGKDYVDYLEAKPNSNKRW